MTVPHSAFGHCTFLLLAMIKVQALSTFVCSSAGQQQRGAEQWLALRLRLRTPAQEKALGCQATDESLCSLKQDPN
jgi:hypothetical protein